MFDNLRSQPSGDVMGPQAAAWVGSPDPRQALYTTAQTAAIAEFETVRANPAERIKFYCGLMFPHCGSGYERLA